MIIQFRLWLNKLFKKAEEYLQELIEGDLVGEDNGRWCVNVKEIK